MEVTLEREHQILLEARDHLSKGWLAYELFENGQRYGDGPVCAHGAILRSCQTGETPFFQAVNGIWKGIYRQGPLFEMFEQLDNISEEMFGENLVMVNNVFGQDSALMVFNVRIKQVEDEIANKLIESANQASLEPALATAL